MHSRGMGWDSSEDLEQLEELGDDAIIAQQSGAHPLKPPTRVVTEPRTVVVKDHPHSSAVATSPGHTPGKSSRAEATVVIRDRRKLDKMRAKITRGRRSSIFKPFYIWGGVGAVAFILGGLAAFFVSGSTSQAAESRTTNEPAIPAAAPKMEQHAAAALRKPEPAAPAPKPAEPAPEVLDLDEPHQDATPEVRLDELPVEKEPAKGRR